VGVLYKLPRISREIEIQVLTQILKQKQLRVLDLLKYGIRDPYAYASTLTNKYPTFIGIEKRGRKKHMLIALFDYNPEDMEDSLVTLHLKKIRENAKEKLKEVMGF